MAMHEFEHPVYGVTTVSDALKKSFDANPEYRYLGEQGRNAKKTDNKAEAKK